jgi:hypothetical protein
MSKMKAILTFPPDFDGELHVGLERTESSSEHDYLRVELIMSVKRTDSAIKALRELGDILQKQPLKIYNNF